MAHAANPTDKGSAPAPARDAAASTNEVTALLLEVLRNVNREVETSRDADRGLATTRDLEGAAQQAVVHFRAISRDLRTPADGGASFSTNASAPSASTGTAGASGITGTAATPAAGHPGGSPDNPAAARSERQR